MADCVFAVCSAAAEYSYRANTVGIDSVPGPHFRELQCIEPLFMDYIFGLSVQFRTLFGNTAHNCLVWTSTSHAWECSGIGHSGGRLGC
jgi:hypothetical protein